MSLAMILWSNKMITWYVIVDAKTTKRGITNADSIPFFMRRSQWEFLQTLSPDTPYYIARVFMGSDDIVKFIRISEHVKN